MRSCDWLAASSNFTSLPLLDLPPNTKRKRYTTMGLFLSLSTRITKISQDRNLTGIVSADAEEEQQF
uniref:Uncharacterized protein n=1 Tax=Salix viminalis TaxID=40686 RepID=A0A6N2LZQ6_SALVM